MRHVSWGTRLLRLLGLLALFMLLPAHGQAPEGYPVDYAATIASARQEGKVVVYSPTDMAEARYLIADFTALYPGVEVEYHEYGSSELNSRFLNEVQAGGATADVLWSSAMDLQAKLVNDGHALTYASPERARLPEWAVWKNEAWGTTLEPIGFAYNKRLLAPAEVPRTHAEFIRLLKSDPLRFRARVITYDLENSGLGFLYATQDAKASNMLWQVAQVLGAAQARQVTSTAAMFESVGSGQSLLAYNLLGSYAYSKVRTDPNIGFVYPQDYVLVGSRIAFIHRRAAHPNAAKLWLDYLLSKRGQTVLSQQAGLFALRSDVRAVSPASQQLDASGNIRPIGIGPSLMTYLDRGKREDFLKRWTAAWADAR